MHLYIKKVHEMDQQQTTEIFKEIEKRNKTKKCVQSIQIKSLNVRFII